MLLWFFSRQDIHSNSCRSIVLLTSREPSPTRCGHSFKVILSGRKFRTDIISLHAMNP